MPRAGTAAPGPEQLGPPALGLHVCEPTGCFSPIALLPVIPTRVTLATWGKRAWAGPWALGPWQPARAPSLPCQAAPCLLLFHAAAPALDLSSSQTFCESFTTKVAALQDVSRGGLCQLGSEQGQSWSDGFSIRANLFACTA